MFILKPRGCSGVWVGSWKKGVKSYSIHRIWHENRKEGFAINQDRTCCRWAGLEGEIKNQVSDMFSLRNLSGIEVETLSSSWMDKSRVQGEGDKWSLKPATRGNSDKWAKKPKDRILEALSLRTCGNKEQLAKKTEKEWPLRTKTRRAEYSGSEGRSQDEGSDDWVKCGSRVKNKQDGQLTVCLAIDPKEVNEGYLLLRHGRQPEQKNQSSF